VLASAGTTVIVPARDLDKAKKALQPFPEISLDPLDRLGEI
jgi:hypothetical protein